MNNSPMLVVVTGFAYTLEHIKESIDIPSDGINRAYLFSYQSNSRDRYLGNLMHVILNNSDPVKENWINYCAMQYSRNPIARREEFFASCPEYFNIQRASLPEDTFDFSVLNSQGRKLGMEVCQDYSMFFKKIIQLICKKQSTSSPEYSCGIIFTTSD